MAGKEIAVKKYVVRLDAEERDRLNELIRKGKRPAQLLTKARILLKADVSDAGEGLERQPDRRGTGHQHRHCRADQAPAGRGTRRCWPANATRTPPGGGFFDGAAEAKLIALTLSPAPQALPDGACVCSRRRSIETAHCRARQRLTEHSQHEAAGSGRGLHNSQLAFELRHLGREHGTDRLHCLRSPVGMPLDGGAYLLDVLPGGIGLPRRASPSPRPPCGMPP